MMDWRLPILGHEWLAAGTKGPSLQNGAFRSNLAAQALKLQFGLGWAVGRALVARGATWQANSVG
jgi:hypothetical protein